MKNFLLLGILALGFGCASNQNAYISNPAVIEPDGLSKAVFQAVIDWRDPDYEKISAACHLATNEVRLKNGGQGLRWNATLEKAANQYATESAQGSFLAHEHPTNQAMRLPDQRVAAAGGKYPLTSENLAWIPGYPVAPNQPIYVRGEGFALTENGPVLQPHTYASLGREVVNGWLNSPGHRENLLDKTAREVGCGAFRTYDDNLMAMVTFVQKFQVQELLE